MKYTINRRLLLRISVGLVPVAAAVVLFADTNSFTLKMRDDCDPKTFNATIGPGTCIGKGETTFPNFLAEFNKEGEVDDWSYSKDHATVDLGGTVQLTNRGGETHTFTKVAAFGGGFVPILNGKMAPRPECAQSNGLPQPPSADNIFVTAGTSMMGPTAGGTTLPFGTKTKFQCCIHPWMRTEIEVKSEH